MQPKLGVEKGKVILEAYNPAWAELFKCEEAAISLLLKGTFIYLGHIGSTAIPNIKSKPIIDILVVLRQEFPMDEAEKALNQLGYLKNEFPWGNNNFFIKNNGNLSTHHLHLLYPDMDWQQYVIFRDYLIHHPEEARKYETLKISLEASFKNDRLKYTAAKKDFITQIKEKAAAYHLEISG